MGENNNKPQYSIIRRPEQDVIYLTKYNNVKDRKISTMLQKNEKLETAIRDLTKQLLQEKKASNVLIDHSKSDAETAVTKAFFLIKPRTRRPLSRHGNW